MLHGGETARKLILRMAASSGIAAVARPLVGGVGAILMLHRVTAFPEKPDSVNAGLNVAPAFLESLIQDMKARGIVFVAMDEVVERLRAGRQPGQFATITLDDGYRDNLTEALPVFERLQTPFTVYIAPGLIDGQKDLWWEAIEDVALAGKPITLRTSHGSETLNCSGSRGKAKTIARLQRHLTEEVSEEEQRATLREIAATAGVDADAPRRQMLMNWDEIRQIAAHPLATIGAHTVHHYALARLPEEAARLELLESACILEKKIGRKPRHLAYPYGYAAAVGPREIRLAREAGYASAVTTRHGVLQAGHAGHLHALPRISVNGRYQQLAYMRAMLSGITTPMANRGKLLVIV